MLLGVLQVREQRPRLVGRADLDVLADGQVIDRREEDRVAHDAGDRVDDQLVGAGAVDDAGAASVDVARRGGAVTAAAATGRGGDGLGGHLVGTLGSLVAATAAARVLGRGGVLGGGLSSLGSVAMSAAAATGVLSGGLGGLGGSAVAVTMAVTMAVSATVSAAATAALLGGLRSRGLGGSGLLGALLLTLATAAATAAAVLGRDGVGVDQLEHLTVSHVFSLSFGPTGHFSEPYPV